VRGEASVSVRVEGVPTNCLLTVDGQQAVNLQLGDEIRCRRSENTVNLVRLKESGFFEALRSKLSWGER
jgi:NAD+ kinase